MPAAAHPDLKIVLAGEPDRRDHVVGARTAGDHPRTPVDHGIPDRARLVISGVARHQHPAIELGVQLLQDASDHGWHSISTVHPWSESAAVGSTRSIVWRALATHHSARMLAAGGRRAPTFRRSPKASGLVVEPHELRSPGGFAGLARGALRARARRAPLARGSRCGARPRDQLPFGAMDGGHSQPLGLAIETRLRVSTALASPCMPGAPPARSRGASDRDRASPCGDERGASRA
jgi:hypothetical protein